MRSKSLAWVVVWVAVCVSACSSSRNATGGDPAETHRQIRELRVVYVAQDAAGDSVAAFETIRKMSALDPEHPLPCSLVVRRHRAKKTFEIAEQELRDFGAEGPGLTYGQGRIQLSLDKLDEAEAIFRKALTGYREIGHVAGQGSAHIMLGLLLMKGNRIDEAATEYDQAARAYSSLQDPDTTLHISSKLIELEEKRSGFGGAKRLIDEWAPSAEQASDPDFKADWWRIVGKIYDRAGLKDEARESLGRAAEFRRASGNSLDLGVVLRELARVEFETGREEQADSAWSEAIVVYEEAGDLGKAVSVRVDRGRHHSNTGRPYEALPLLEEALAYARSLGQGSQLAYALAELGQAQLDAGMYLQAERSLVEAIEVGKPKLKRSIRSRISLSAAMSRTGNLTGALEQAQIALENSRERKYVDLEGRATNNLGHCYHKIGRYDLAQQYFREYIEIVHESSNVTEEAFARVNLGTVLMNEGLSEQARAEFDRAIDLDTELPDRKNAATARLWLAQLSKKQGRRAEGLRQIEQTLQDLREIGDPPRVVSALIVLGASLLDLGRFDSAFEAYAEAADIAGEHGLPERLWVATVGLAEVQAGRGNPKEALERYRLALETIESLRMRLETDEFKMRYLARRDDVYEQAISAHSILDPGATAETFALAERARARSLSDLLAEARTVMRAELPEAMAKRERELIDAVSSAAQRRSDAESPQARDEARRALESAEQRLQLYKLELRREAPRSFDVVYPEPARLVEIRTHVLADDEWMLRYFVGTERTLVWVIDREAARLHELPAPGEIADLVAGYLDCCARAGVSRPGIEEAQALGLALLPSELPKKKKLIVVPDGPLYHLPFDVLRHDGKFLVEDYEIQVVPSATMLRVTREHETAVAPKRFLGVGNPSVESDDQRFPSLPYAAKALTEIAARFPETDRVVLTGKDATKTRFRALPLDSFRYVHFATHGLLDRENPRYYGLMLSPLGEDDGSGYLYFSDVFGLRLRSELVVLSACSSGEGELLRGEGLVGMTGAFLYAGSRSVLASLWNVNDRSTAEFMTEFYGEIAGGRSVQDALRRTKLAFLRSDRPARRQPYRWAPFVLVGDPGAN